MESEKFQNIKKEQINKEKLVAMISNIVTHTIYLFLLIALATTLNGQDTYYLKEQTEKLVKVIMEEIIVSKNAKFPSLVFSSRVEKHKLWSFFVAGHLNFVKDLTLSELIGSGIPTKFRHLHAFISSFIICSCPIMRRSYLKKKLMFVTGSALSYCHL